MGSRYVVWNSEFCERVQQATNLDLPVEFVAMLNSFPDKDRLHSLGFYESPDAIVAARSDFVLCDTPPAMLHFGFLPVLESNSNWLLVGSGRSFRGCIGGLGVIFRDDGAGLMFGGARTFFSMLEATARHESRECIELLIDEKVRDVIRDSSIVEQCDDVIRANLGIDEAAYDNDICAFIHGASEKLCIELLSLDNFFIQEAAARRLGRLRAHAAIGPLSRLASIVVEHGRADQHIAAAQWALKRIRGLS